MEPVHLSLFDPDTAEAYDMIHRLERTVVAQRELLHAAVDMIHTLTHQRDLARASVRMERHGKPA